MSRKKISPEIGRRDNLTSHNVPSLPPTFVLTTLSEIKIVQRGDGLVRDTGDGFPTSNASKPHPNRLVLMQYFSETSVLMA